MRDLTTVLQDLYHREINCRIESFWDCGFRIVLGDRLNGELAALTVPVEELPGAGERLWSLALQHHPVIAAPPVEEAAVAKVLPLSRVIAQAVPETVFPVAEIADPAAEADVLCYTVLPDNQHFETIWYNQRARRGARGSSAAA